MQPLPFIRHIIFTCFITITSCAIPIKAPIVQAPEQLPPEPSKPNIRVALVLGGGGARSLAHAGVIEVLEKNHIPIDLIVGTSAGSIVGALYADEPSQRLLKAKLMSAKKWDLLDPSFLQSTQMLSSLIGPISGNGLEKFLLTNLKSKNIEELKIPFIAVATDIKYNKLFPIKSGPIIPAVHASSAIPPFFSPVKLYNTILTDGGVIAPTPVIVAKEYNPKIIISVDISCPPEKREVTNMISLTYRAMEIFYYELSRMQSSQADIDIHPNLDGYGTFDDINREKIYNIGKNSAEQALPKILHKLADHGISLYNFK